MIVLFYVDIKRTR